jgi:CheY-like chemotaxis protein
MALDRNAPTDRTRIRYSVLLISQHPEDKELLQEFLTVLACTLESASSWAAALRTLKRQSFGVVICESQLPDSTWEQVLSCLARLAHPPPLVVISRLADEQFMGSGVEPVRIRRFSKAISPRRSRACCGACSGPLRAFRHAARDPHDTTRVGGTEIGDIVTCILTKV